VSTDRYGAILSFPAFVVAGLATDPFDRTERPIDMASSPFPTGPSANGGGGGGSNGWMGGSHPQFQAAAPPPSAAAERDDFGMQTRPMGGKERQWKKTDRRRLRALHDSG
jgi:hypothetical protein